MVGTFAPPALHPAICPRGLACLDQGDGFSCPLVGSGQCVPLSGDQRTGGEDTGTFPHLFPCSCLRLAVQEVYIPGLVLTFPDPPFRLKEHPCAQTERVAVSRALLLLAAISAPHNLQFVVAPLVNKLSSFYLIWMCPMFPAWDPDQYR